MQNTIIKKPKYQMTEICSVEEEDYMTIDEDDIDLIPFETMGIIPIIPIVQAIRTNITTTLILSSMTEITRIIAYRLYDRDSVKYTVILKVCVWWYYPGLFGLLNVLC